MLDDVLGFFVGAEIGDRIGSALRRPFVGRRRARGHVRGALRVISGEVPGLARAWTRGTVTVGNRLLSFRGVDIPVSSISALSRDPGSLIEWSRVHMDSVIYRVRTGTAVIEWAIPGAHVSWALRRLAEGSAPT